jgi:DNA-binding NtrC family response regulator
MTAPTIKINVGSPLCKVEQEIILATLEYYKGNRTWAAKALGISIRTIRNKIKLYNNTEHHRLSPIEAIGQERWG